VQCYRKIRLVINDDVMCQREPRAEQFDVVQWSHLSAQSQGNIAVDRNRNNTVVITGALELLKNWSARS